jgi:hypothetical protein
MGRLTFAFPFAVALAAAAGLTAGSLPKDRPVPGGGGSGPERAGPAGPARSDEEPEVAAYFKSKGWSLVRDRRISDGKPLTFLSVENRDKPFEDISLSADDYKMIARSGTVQVLDLRKVKTTDDGLKAVAGVRQLEGMIVNGEGVTDAGVKALAGCKSLDNVTLFGTKKVTDAGIKELAALPKLQALYLAAFTLNGSAFEAFAGSTFYRYDR